MDLRVRSVSGGAASPADLKRVSEILQARMKLLGASGSVTAQPGGVLVFVKGASRAEMTGQTGTLLFAIARLELYDFVPALVSPSLSSSTSAVVASRISSIGRAFFVSSSRTGAVVARKPEPGR